MIRVLPVILALSVAIYCLVECVQTDRRLVRYLPKAMWLFLILVIPVIGPVAWLLFGRPHSVRTERTPRATTSRRPPPAPAPRAPDDDPAFLAKLDEQRRLAAREQEARRREASSPDVGLPEEGAATDEDPESRRDPGS